MQFRSFIAVLLLFLSGVALFGQCVIIDSVPPICQGSSILINAVLQPGCLNGSNSYTFEIQPTYSPESYTLGTAIDPFFTTCTSTAFGSHDDCIAGPFDIGFSFCFFNHLYTQFWVGSNGWISFSQPPGTSWCTFTSQVIPSTNPEVPKNAIFAPWEDWLPTYPALSTNVYYYTTGTSPFQKLVVYWKRCRLYACPNDPMVEGTFQIVLNEQGGVIDNHIEEKPACSDYNATQGVQNDSGTIAFTATGRNNTQWITSNESTRFVPSGFTWYENSYPGGPIVGYGSKLLVTPAVTTTYYCEVETCNNTPEVASITVIVLPHPTITGPQSVCDGILATYTTESGMTNYTWTVTGGTIISGADNDTAVVIWNVPAGVHTISVNYDDPVSSCVGITPVVKPIDYHFPAVPVISGEAQPCQNNPGYIYSTAAGNSNYIWTVTNGTVTAGGTPSDETVTVTWPSITPGQVSVNYTDVFGCISSSPGVKIINPIESPLGTTTSPQQVCSGQSLTVALTSSIAGPGVTYTWAQPVCTNIADGCAVTGGSGSDITLTPVLAGTDPGTVTYSVTPTYSGCDGPSFPVVIDVIPVPSVNPVTPQIICSGEQTQPVLLSSDVTSLAVDYSWTVTCDVPWIPVCPGNGSGNPVPAAIISNTDTVPRFVTYLITPSVAGCPGNTASFQIQVNPSPTVTTFPMNQEICSDTQNSQVNLIANVSGTTFTWIATPSSANISGFQPSGTGVIPPQTIHNSSSSAQGYVDYDIIPSSQIGMACPGAPAVYRIYVNPLPAPSIAGPLQVCYDQSGSIYSTPSFTNHDYLWTVTGAVSFTGNNTDSIIVDWGPGPSGTVQLTEIDQSHPTNCSTATPVLDIIINPAPAPVISAIPALPASPCGNTAVTYTLGSPMPGHTYQWTVSGGMPVSGTGSSILVTWGNTNPASVTVTEDVAYAPGVVCSASTTRVVTLNLIPDPSGPVSGPNSTCQSATTDYTYTVAPINNADGYSWWYDPPAGVSITNNAASAVLTFDQTALSGNLFVRGLKTGCASGQQSPPLAITVHNLPLVTLSACFDQVTTMNAKPFVLKGGSPLGPGGSYYIDGIPVPGGVLNPSTFSPTVHNISYSYTDVYNCTDIAATTLAILPSNAGYQCFNNIFTDPRNSDPATNSYRTTLFTANGRTSCWMLKNFIWGTTVSAVQPQTDNCINERYCAANDNSCTSFGSYFQWDELMQYGSTPGWFKGVCPPGWHVPTSLEWQDLIDAVTGTIPGDGIAGSNLKDPNPALGFRALLNGINYLNSNWAFTSGVVATMFWTSTLNNGKPISRGLNTLNPSVSVYEGSRADAFPVRCVKD